MKTHDPSLPAGYMQLTQYIPTDEYFNSQYGFVDGWTWLREESERIQRSGIETMIVNHDKLPRMSALLRKARK